MYSLVKKGKEKMKKNIIFMFVVLLVSVIVIPTSTYAEGLNLTGTTSETLSEAFDAEAITGYDLSNYSESGDKVSIYVFRKDGCINCKNFLTYIKDVLLPQYGDKIKVVSYELSSNQSNFNLLNKVATFFNQNQTTYATPYVVVGSKTFSGAIYHNNSMRDEIEATIQSHDTFDVINEMVGGNQNINNNKIFTDGGVTFTSEGILNSSYALKVSVVDLKNVVLDQFSYIAAYDISMYNGGVIVPLSNGSFTIKIPVSEVYDTYKVAYVNNGAIVEQLDATYENGFVTFTTTHLSEYAIYGKNSSVNSNDVVNEKNPNTVDGIYKNIMMLILGSITLVGSTLLYKRFN